MATFAELPHGEEIVIQYVSEGSWGVYGYEFRYTRVGHGRFEVDQLHLVAEAKTNFLIEGSREPVARIDLERGEAAQLDRRIEEYREAEGNSLLLSTVRTIRVTHKRRSRILAEESFCNSLGWSSELGFEKMIHAIKGRDSPSSDP